MTHVLVIYVEVPDTIDPATTDPFELAEQLIDDLAVDPYGAGVAMARWEAS